MTISIGKEVARVTTTARTTTRELKAVGGESVLNMIAKMTSEGLERLEERLQEWKRK